MRRAKASQQTAQIVAPPTRIVQIWVLETPPAIDKGFASPNRSVKGTQDGRINPSASGPLLFNHHSRVRNRPSPPLFG